MAHRLLSVLSLVPLLACADEDTTADSAEGATVRLVFCDCDKTYVDCSAGDAYGYTLLNGSWSDQGFSLEAFGTNHFEARSISTVGDVTFDRYLHGSTTPYSSTTWDTAYTQVGIGDGLTTTHGVSEDMTACRRTMREWGEASGATIYPVDTLGFSASYSCP
jgi:hypothetical protein